MKVFRLWLFSLTLAVAAFPVGRVHAQELVTLASSTFEVNLDLDGWHGTNNSGNTRPVTYKAGGATSNSLGYISMVEGIADSAFNHFIAPAKFLGDKRAAYNGYLAFYYRQTVNSSGNTGHGLVKLTAGTNHLAFDLPTLPTADTWLHFMIPLNENAGWHFAVSTNDTATSNQLATRDDMIRVLSGLTLMEIRAEWASVNNEVDDLDDVMLLGQLSGATTPQVVPMTFTGVTIDGAVGNSYRIEYRAAQDVSNTWLTLTNLVLPSSPYLFIDTNSPSAQARFYRAVLSP